MREIKFRAWDNENQYMITSKQGVFTALQYNMKITRQNNGYYNNGELLKPINGKYTLMQYTGLKDKNGVEIYEGDILENTAVNFKFVVKFGKTKYVLQKLEFPEDSLDMYDFFHRIPIMFEVVGNIYDKGE